MPTDNTEDRDDVAAAPALDASEESPLLPPQTPDTDEDRYTDQESAQKLERQNVLILVGVIIFLIGTFAGTFTPPINQIMEDILCRQYHPDVYGSVKPDDPDSICKSQDVQQQLAMLRGWAATFDCIPGILLGVPYGILSDSWGRKPVTVLSFVGLCLNCILFLIVLGLPDIFPLWTMWFASVGLVVGGGTGVTLAMMYTYVADVVPVAGRATVFFQLNAVILIADLVANPVTAVLMARSPWLSIALSMVLVTLGLLVCLVLPETNGIHKKKRESAAAQRPPGAEGSAKASTFQRLLSHVRSSGLEAWDFIVGNTRVFLLVQTLVFVVLGRWVQEMLLQYATRRYHWRWSQATFLLSIRSASNLVILLTVLPAVSWWLVSRRGMSGMAKDLLLARVSGVLLVLGSLWIALATNGYWLAVGLVLFSSGGGINSLIRSLANALVEEHHVGILNTLVSIIDQIALMVGGPLLATTLSLGFEMGGVWVGLPFMCSALMFATSTLVVLVFRLPASPRAPNLA